MVLLVNFVHINGANLYQPVIGTLIMNDDRRPKYRPDGTSITGVPNIDRMGRALPASQI